MAGWSTGGAPWFSFHNEIKTVISIDIKSIGYCAFQDYTSLTSVTIPTTMTEIHI